MIKTYISREALLKDWPCCDEPADAYQYVRNFPAADVRENKRGRWEWNDNNGYYYCGKCGSISPMENQDGEYCDCPPYCPNCGAQMNTFQNGNTRKEERT